MNAIILMDAPEDPEERLKFEAEYFIGQDSEVDFEKAIDPINQNNITHQYQKQTGDIGKSGGK